MTRVLDSQNPSAEQDDLPDQPLWTVLEFGSWARIIPHEVYRQIALGRVPGVIRFGRSIRIDPQVAIPALRGEGGDAA